VLIAGLSRLSFYGEGAWFFASQSLWSFGAIFILLAIDRSKLVFSVAGIELSVIFLNLLACIGFLTSFDYFFYQYEGILFALTLVEAAILLAGAPVNGLFNRNPKLRRTSFDRGPAIRRYVQINPILARQESRT